MVKSRHPVAFHKVKLQKAFGMNLFYLVELLKEKEAGCQTS